MNKKTIPFSVRLASPQDILHLEGIERSAATAFSIYPEYSPDWPTVPQEKLQAMAKDKKLWVAVSEENKPIGFAGCRDMDNILYVHEISVSADCQKQGIGRKLMDTILSFASLEQYDGVGLTTSRDVPWNMPFYKTLGFSEMTDQIEQPMLWEQLQHEIKDGANPRTRCTMLKRFRPS